MNVGASFTLATSIENIWVSEPPFPSETSTVTELRPTCQFAGVQEITPVPGSIVIPVGNAERLYVRVSPKSMSAASTS